MARPLTEAAQYAQITVRLPKKMLAALKREAAAIRRPMNTEIILLLEEALAVRRQRQAASQDKPARATTIRADVLLGA